MKASLPNFASEAQMLQFLAKEYAKKFFPNEQPEEFYKDWKLKKGISSANQLTKEEMRQAISSFEVSIDMGVA